MTDSIIKYFNIVEAGSFHFLMSFITSTMVALVLETVKPAFSWCIVPAISFAAHRANHAKFLELVLKSMAGVLAALSH